MLEDLAPARRRLLRGTALLLALVVLAVTVAVLLGRDRDAAPVDQSRLGPVLLLPGYGGSVAGFDPLVAALRDAGREVQVVASPGDGRGDLREHARRVADAAQQAVDDGAPSVDVVGYSAGGVVARWFVAELDGASITRRVVTLASPHHGTDLAGAAAGLGGDTCPEACQQLAPGSDLLATLNRGDETPAGPQWVALWTTDDDTVVPPTSGRLAGAVEFAVQDVCPGLAVEHSQVPSDPSVVAITLAELAAPAPRVPGPGACVSR